MEPSAGAGADNRQWNQWTDYVTYMDNGRRAHEQAQNRIQELIANIRQIKTESKASREKLELNSQWVAKKNAEVTIADVKVRVQEEIRQKVEQEIEEKSIILAKMKKELQMNTMSMLHTNIEFVKTWNCTQLGRDYRSNMRPKRMDEIVAQKFQLEHELHDYLIAEKAYEDMVTEKIETEEKIKPEEQELSRKAEELIDQIRMTKDTILNLNKSFDVMKQRFAEETKSYSMKRKMKNDTAAVVQYSDAMNNTNVTPKKPPSSSFQFKKRNTQMSNTQY